MSAAFEVSAVDDVEAVDLPDDNVPATLVVGAALDPPVFCSVVQAFSETATTRRTVTSSANPPERMIRTASALFIRTSPALFIRPQSQLHETSFGNRRTPGELIPLPPR